MSLKEERSPDEDELHYLKRVGRFSELLLMAWGQVEHFIDLLVVGKYGVSPSDSKSNFLRDSSFQKKIDFLRKENVLNAKEYGIVQAFQKERNHVFHSVMNRNLIFGNIELDKRTKIMDDAVLAAQTLARVFIRKVNSDKSEDKCYKKAFFKQEPS